MRLVPLSPRPGRRLPPLLLLLALAATSASAQEDSSEQQFSVRFTCEGRESGFYADIAAGCQRYHMCDEAGRVFTHTCPERTLFQQRTMVCDHWYMVECDGVRGRAPSEALRPPPPAEVVPLGGPPARKRHSHRVLATFPYRRGNDTTNPSSTIRSPSSQDKLESFRISSLPSSTTRPIASSTATIERVPRPSFYPVANPFLKLERNQERGAPNLDQPAPISSRAKIERVYKESVLSPPGDEVISRVQYVSPFREAKAGVQFASTTPSPSTQVAPSLIENKYTSNPYFESYFRTAFTIAPPTPFRVAQTTTQSNLQHEEEENSENRLEIVIPDPRKMFYIPDSNYDPGDASKGGGTLLVIELPGKNQMKFQRVEVTEARNHDCPQCHPSFLLPGLCRPCVLIR